MATRIRLHRARLLLAGFAIAGLGAAALAAMSARREHLPGLLPQPPGRPHVPSLSPTAAFAVPPGAADIGRDYGEATVRSSEDGEPESPVKPPDLAALPSAELARRAMGSGDPWLQAEAMEELSTRRAPEALSTALTLLGSARADVRLVAVDTLKDLGEEDAVPELRGRLHLEPDPRVRIALQQALDGLTVPAEQ